MLGAALDVVQLGARAGARPVVLHTPGRNDAVAEGNDQYAVRPWLQFLFKSVLGQSVK